MVALEPAPSFAADPLLRGGHVEDDIHRRVCLLAGLMAAVAIAPTSFLLRVPALVPLASGAFGVVLLWFYREARHHRHHRVLTFVLTLGVIGVCWFPASGTLGSALLYQASALVYAVVIFRRRTRAAAVLSLVGLTLLLIAIEHADPGRVRPFHSEAARMLQLASGVVLGSGLVALVLGAVLSAYDRDRESLRVSVAALDVSRHELAQSRATLAALFNSARDMVWLVEPATCALTQFNEAFAEYCQRTLGVVPRLGITPILGPPPEMATWLGYYRRALIEGAFTCEHVAGSGRTLLLSFSRVAHEGVVFGVSAFSHDITEMRAQELARADMERQLLQSQKMESLGRLAGGVAHDFNNMLTVILGQAEYLSGRETDPLKRECLAAVERAAQRSADLTRKLLAFGRRGMNVVEETSVQAVVRDCVVMLAPSLRPNVRLDLELDDTWSVDADPSQLSQVVLNLCLNANDAMPDGGPIRVATRDVLLDLPSGGPAEFVELRVSDTGVGIAEDVKSRIFEPFFSTKPGSLVSGTGLGLATVDGVVHLHGGSVTVESAVHEGSTFTVRLPRGRLKRDAAVAPPRRLPAGGRILVVDDEPMVRNVATTALETFGFDAVVATDGIEAVRLFSEHHTTLAGVLLDLKMPRMGGSEAFAVLRGIDPTVPILICSGYGDNEEVERLIRGGARGLLMKPFNLKDFGEALARLRSLRP